MDANFLAELLVDSLVDRGIDRDHAQKVIETARSLNEKVLQQAQINSPNDMVVFTLTDYGNNKIEAIKFVRQLTGLGLKEAKQAVESCPWSYEVRRDTLQNLLDKTEYHSLYGNVTNAYYLKNRHITYTIKG